MPRIPRRAFKGLDRQLLRKLVNAITSIRKMDTRRTIFAEAHSTTPITFVDSPARDGALTSLLNRANQCLDLTD